MSKKQLTIEQKYVIIANAHIHANRRIKAKKEQLETMKQLIKPYNNNQNRSDSK